MSEANRHRLRAGVPQSSGEETAASAEVVIAAYGAMAIWWSVPVLAGIALVLGGALDASQAVGEGTQCSTCMRRADVSPPMHS